MRAPVRPHSSALYPQIRQFEPIGLTQVMDGLDIMDKMDVTRQMSLLSVHVVHKVHDVHLFRERLQSRLPNLASSAVCDEAILEGPRSALDRESGPIILQRQYLHDMAVLIRALDVRRRGKARSLKCLLRESDRKGLAVGQRRDDRTRLVPKLNLGTSQQAECAVCYDLPVEI